MRVQARPRVHAAHDVGELDAVDLDAIKLAHEWGVDGEIVLVKVRPCRWEQCGGSVLSFGGESRCLLCCRVPGTAATAPIPNGYGPRNASGAL